MKTNNMIKILVLIIIILSIGLLVTAIKLKTMDKSIVNKDTPVVVDKSSVDILEIPEDELVENGEEDKQDEPIVETPTEDIKENTPEDEEPPIDIKSTEEDKPSKDSKPSNQGKPKDEKPDNKDKPNKDKPSKEEKKDNKKDNKSKDNKKDKSDKKDKSKDEKAMVKPKYISKDEATKIGLNKVGPGAKLIKIKSDLDDNPPKYDLKIILGNYEYEIEIHAITGALIDFEKEEVDD